MSPIYEYKCPKHGRFEVLRTLGSLGIESCPHCGSQCLRVVSKPAPAIIRETERLPLGNKSRGRYLTSEETGGLPILIPSFGALEKEEIDYVAEAAIEKEKGRISPPRDSQIALDNIVKEARKTPKGKRKQTMDRIQKEGMR